MKVNENNTKILHYLTDEFSIPIYIVEYNGTKYISTSHEFIEDTPLNRESLIESPYVENTVLDRLDDAPGIEWHNLKDGTHLFSFSDIHSFKIKLPSLRFGNFMFYRSDLRKIKSYLPLLEDGTSMFAHSLLLKFKIKLPSLVNGNRMFCESSLRKIKSYLPSIVKANSMFAYSNLKKFKIDLPSLEYCSHMFYKTDLKKFKSLLPVLKRYYSMFYRTKVFNKRLTL